MQRLNSRSRVRKLVLFALIVAGAACDGACVQEVSHPTPSLSSGECAMNGVACELNDSCCSLWCVNGYCGQRQP